MADTVSCSGLAVCLLSFAAALWSGWYFSTKPETTNSTFTLQDAKDAVLQDILSGKIEIPVKREAPTFTLQEARDAVLKELLSGNIELTPKGESQSEAATYLTAEDKNEVEKKLKEFCVSEVRQQAANQTRQYEEQLQTMKKFCVSELRQQAANQTRLYEEQLQTLKREFEDKLLAVQEQCQTNITSVNGTVFRSLDDAKSEMAGRQRELDDLLKTQPLTLETRGFMNIETFGPILISVAVMEVVLVMCVCGLLCPATPRRGGSGQLQGGTGPGQQSHSHSAKQQSADQPAAKQQSADQPARKSL